MKDTFRYTLLPVILGANWQARHWAAQYRRRYHVRSYVMNEKYHISLLGTLSLRFRRLSPNHGYADFILSDLIRPVEESPEKLAVLIAATPHYAAFIRQNRSLLERYFIISDPELSFLHQEE